MCSLTVRIRSFPVHFAPPSAYDDDRDKATESDFITQTFTPATIVPAASIDLAETAEAAYARRVALSKRTSTAAAPPPPTEILSSHIPLQAVPFVDSVDTASIIMPQRSPPAPLSLASETLSAPTSSSDLSRTTHDTEILASTSIAIMATPSSSASGTNSVKAAAEAIAAKLAALAGPDPEPEPAKDQDVLDFLASLDREDDDEDAAAASDKKSKKKGKEYESTITFVALIGLLISFPGLRSLRSSWRLKAMSKVKGWVLITPV